MGKGVRIYFTSAKFPEGYLPSLGASPPQPLGLKCLKGWVAKFLVRLVLHDILKAKIMSIG